MKHLQAHRQAGALCRLCGLGVLLRGPGDTQYRCFKGIHSPVLSFHENSLLQLACRCRKHPFRFPSSSSLTWSLLFTLNLRAVQTSGASNKEAIQQMAFSMSPYNKALSPPLPGPGLTHRDVQDAQAPSQGPPWTPSSWERRSLEFPGHPPPGCVRGRGPAHFSKRNISKQF